MNHPVSVLSQPGSILFALCLGMASSAAFAQTANSAQTQYQQDIALCKSGQTTTESQATCIREAGAALQAARRGQLTAEPGSGYQQDATNRCAALPPDQRQDCMALMNDSNATIQGSVGGGGILRTTTITIPGDSRMTGSMPPAPPSPAPVR